MLIGRPVVFPIFQHVFLLLLLVFLVVVFVLLLLFLLVLRTAVTHDYTLLNRLVLGGSTIPRPS
jgi:hypothetical protein